MRSLSEVCAKSMIFAPGRVERTASSTRPFTLVATKTMSAPRPSVSSFSLAATSSRARIERVCAPHLLRKLEARSGWYPSRRWCSPQFQQHGEHQADRALSLHQHDIVRLRIALLNRFQAGVHAAPQRRRFRRARRPGFSRRRAQRSSPSRGHIARSRRPPAQIQRSRRPSYRPGHCA